MENPPWLGHVMGKNRPEKCPFVATNNWIALAVQWSVKSLIFWKGGEEDEENHQIQSIVIFKQTQKINEGQNLQTLYN